MFVLGIDGGGTKTEAAIVTHSGKVCSFVSFGPININNQGQLAVKQELVEQLLLLREKDRHSFDKIEYAFAGIAGSSQPYAKVFFQELLESVLPANIKIEIDHDGVNALYSATLGQAGIVHIAGTGSLTFGINDEGKSGRRGGWGWLIDAGGSGYSLGRQSLQAVFADYDRIGPQTLLTPLILAHYQVDTAKELVAKIYQKDQGVAEIAQLNRFLMEAAERNDTAANEILRHESVRVVTSIRALKNNLFPDRQEKVPISLTGGVIQHSKIFHQLIFTELTSIDMLHPVYTRTSPLGGAVIAAFQIASTPIQSGFSQTFAASLPTVP